MRPWPAAVVLCVVVAGCSAGEAGSLADATLAAPGTGTIEGRVTDDGLVPLVGVNVSVEGGAFALTTEDGSFVLLGLAPGNYTVTANASGHLPASTQVDVLADEKVALRFTLQPMPVGGVYHVTQIKKGTIFCGVAWRHPRIAAPPVVNTTGTAFAACGAFYDTPLSPYDSFVVIFDLTAPDVASVKSLVFETDWVATQAFGRGLSILWEAYQPIVAYTYTEKLRNFTRVQGNSPLHAEVNESVIKFNVTQNQDPNGKFPTHCHEGIGCRFWARAFPYPGAFGASSPVDFAFYMDQRYTHYATEFYGLPNPPGWSSLGDA